MNKKEAYKLIEQKGVYKTAEELGVTAKVLRQSFMEGDSKRENLVKKALDKVGYKQIITEK